MYLPNLLGNESLINQATTNGWGCMAAKVPDFEREIKIKQPLSRNGGKRWQKIFVTLWKEPAMLRAEH